MSDLHQTLDLVLREDARKKITRSTACVYDGFQQVFTNGRCAFCGNKRREAVVAVRQWEIQHRHYFPTSESLRY